MENINLQKRIGGGLTALVMGTLLLGPGMQGSPAHAQAAAFADPAFRNVWERTDLPVSQSKVTRTWVWGPAPGQSLREQFAEGRNGIHLVQYFDKARMEINDIEGDRANPYFVTNGLLAVELISGNMQMGVNKFQSLAPSSAQIAGDLGSDSPTYGALQKVASVGLPGQEHKTAPVTTGSDMPSQLMNKAGAVSSVTSAPPMSDALKAAAYVNETGHNIPAVFWSYLNSQGPIYENGAYHSGPLFNWISAFGYPVTEPYLTTIRVAGQDRRILFQAFQRRILTYSPGNPIGWTVEMGNVGAQYYSWRYETPVPPVAVCQKVPVRGFGQVWAGHAGVKSGLGCPLSYPPLDKELPVVTAYEPFEHGAMLYISRTTYVQEKLIYVLFDDGTMQQFDDTWREGDAVNGGLTAPRNLYEPVRGFGKVWREGTGARVRERLGWATAPEAGASGTYQRFDRGEMYSSGTVKKIWVFYALLNPSSDPTPVPGVSLSPKRYEVYDDTFTP
ncbi:MAG: hypothetical protein M3014_11045 [Chloroflexota bacterium]|nr:hypothetical protein [Chloroflexota bacterium]